jgi:hypothetical protein
MSELFEHADPPIDGGRFSSGNAGGDAILRQRLKRRIANNATSHSFHALEAAVNPNASVQPNAAQLFIPRIANVTNMAGLTLGMSLSRLCR